MIDKENQRFSNPRSDYGTSNKENQRFSNPRSDYGTSNKENRKFSNKSFLEENRKND